MINSYNAQREAIENYFKQAWNSETPVLWNNSRQAPPKTGSWIRVTILNGIANAVSIGQTSVHRNEGLVQVQIFAKKGTGTKVLYDLADIVVNIFSQKQIDSIQFRVPEVIDVGEIEEFYQINVSCPFYRNRIHVKS